MSASKKRKPVWIYWLLIAPAVLIRGFASVYPILNTFYNSFFTINKIRMVHKFIYFDNYTAIFSDSKVIDTLGFTLLFTFTSIALHTIFGVALALLLNQCFKGRKLLRSVTLIPWALPLVVAGIAAAWAFNDMYGFINDLIRRIVPGFSFDWLVSATGSRAAVILVDVWKDTPFYAIMVLAGLQSIPCEIYEAARVDGSGALRSFWHITLPSIGPLMITMTIFFTLWRFTQFDLVYSMTQGGPGTSTSLLSYRVYVEAFKNLNFGYASAISVVLCLIMIVVAAVGFTIRKKIDFES